MKRKKPTAKHTVDELVELGREHAERGELAEAEARFREGLAQDPEHLGVLTLLALLLTDLGNIDEAIDLLERARQAAPGFAPIQLALGSAYAAAGHDDLAVTAMETAIKLDAESTLPLERLARHHIDARRTREAIGLLRRILRRDPNNAQAKFLLAGLAPADVEEKNPVAPPPELIADLFDTYAPRFDQHLVEKLQYGVPKLLPGLLAGAGLAADGSARIVDLGCGTGLAGVEVRPFAKTLIGSDLSPRMIIRARQRGIYDELHVEDLLATLARETNVDVVVAADVLIYVGALDATFAACAKALRPGGLFVFSIERSAGEDVVLLPTLRYAHAESHVAGLAAANGFAVERAEPTAIRQDADRPIEGVVYVLRR